MPHPSAPLRVVASCVLILTAAPGCSFFKSRGPSSDYRPDYAPQCTTSKTPPTADAVVGGLFAIGTVSAATQAAGAFSSSAQNQKDAQSALPGLVLITGAFAAAAAFGFIQSNRCDEAMATWAAAKAKRKEEAQARAEAARQEAQKKAEAAAEEARRREQERLAAEEARRQEENAEQDRQRLAAEEMAGTQNTEGEQKTPDEKPSSLSAVAPKNGNEHPAPVPAGYRSTEGYQKARWGMSRSEIKQLYPAAETANVNGLSLLGFESKVAGHNAITAFGFTSDRLAFVAIVLNNHRPTSAGDLEDFEDMKHLLSTKYGLPRSDETVWNDHGLLAQARSRLGTAIALGEAMKYAKWETADTSITLLANQGGTGIKVHVAYRSKILNADMDAEEERAKANDL